MSYRSLWSHIQEVFPIFFKGAFSPVYYFVPTAAIVLVILFCVIGLIERRVRKRREARGEEVPSGFFFLRGVLIVPLIILALLAAGNYSYFGKYRYGSFLNAYEFYHYYLGSKYAKEIGYYGLYGASLVADQETGLKWKNPKKSIRNLETGRYVDAQLVLKTPEKFKDSFSEERWAEWCKDIEWFKKELIQSRWNAILRDKGYNATPAWTAVVGGLFSNRVSTDSDRAMDWLAALDLILIGIAAGFVTWAFGPRAALIMIILLGTSYMMKFSHMRGAYLRTDFAMTLVIAVCLLKKEYYATAGAFAAYAFLSRVFPAVYLFGLGAKVFWDLLAVAAQGWRRLRDRGAHVPKRLLYAALLGAACVMAGSCLPFLVHWLKSDWLSLPKALLVSAALTAMLAFGTIGVYGLWQGLVNRHYLRFFVAFGLTLAIICSGATVYLGGFGLWKEYAGKIGRHNQDISPWRVGFKYLFIAEWPKNVSLEKSRTEWEALRTKPAEEGKATSWRAGFMKDFREVAKKWQPFTRSTKYNTQPEVWWSMQAAMLIFCLFAVRGLKDHLAFAFSFVPCFFLVSPTYYYYIMLLVPLLFFTADFERPTRAFGTVLMLLLAMAGYVCYSMWKQKAGTYICNSLFLFVIVFYMMILAAFEKRPAGRALGMTILAALFTFYFWQHWPQLKPAEFPIQLTVALLAGFAVLLAVIDNAPFFGYPAMATAFAGALPEPEAPAPEIPGAAALHEDGIPVRDPFYRGDVEEAGAETAAEDAKAVDDARIEPIEASETNHDEDV